MSKYRIVVGTSFLIPVTRGCFYLLLAVSVWTWRSDAFVFQLHFQIALTLLLIALVVASWHRLRISLKTKQPTIIMLSEEGDWRLLNDGCLNSGHIAPDSLLIGPFMNVVVREPATNKCIERHWLCKDQLIETDFRRLCRSIIRVRTQPAKSKAAQ